MKIYPTTYPLDGDFDNGGQHGFLKSESCCVCMSELLNIVTKADNSEKSTGSTFLIRQVLYNHVSHRTLLMKVKTYGKINPKWLGYPLI